MSDVHSTFLYTKGHEWIEKVGEKEVRIGISEYAVEQLGDIVYVELPDVGSSVQKEGEFATVESVKSSSGIFAPVAGTVVSVNEGLEDEPELMNDSPYEEGWLITLESSETLVDEEFMTFDEYEAYVDTLG